MKMALTKIDWKETGRKFSEAANKLKSSTKATAAAIALALGTTSCDWHPMTVSVFSGAQGDYESGATERAITKQEQELLAQKDAYDAYVAQYNDLQTKLVDDSSRGDIRAAKQTRKTINKLATIITDLQQEINEGSVKLSELKQYHIRGKQKYDEEYPVQNQNFKQYKKYN